MAKEQQKKRKGNYLNWLVPGTVILVLLAGVGFFVKVLLSPAGSVKKTQISTVNLMKPPPPPEQKEKPPEPEVPKEAPKENISTPTEAQQPQNDSPDNSPPPGADLGVDAEGGAGGDGFGLVGKKGGKALTLGGGGGGGGGGANRLSLMTKYGWYTAKIQEELKRQMRKRLDENGGIPKGRLQATVKLVLDARGMVVRYQIVASSGNEKMDEALKLSLPGFRVSQPPPEGMPAGMTVRITSQG